jgi:hypothetical protein
MALGAVLLATAGMSPAAAQGLQPGRIAIEAVAAVSTSSDAADDPFVFLDLTTTTRVSQSLDVIVRPYARRLPGGDWDALLYQAEIRYQPIDGLRLEAGIISSPLGLGALELRQDINPAVGPIFYYFSPLPLFDTQADRVQVLSGGYPLGAILSSSGTWWDARAGITDGTPARYRKIFANNNPSSAPQLILGGGITPRVGLRLGAGLAHGTYRDAGDTDYYRNPAPLPDAKATVFNLEGEYAFGYTRLSGEWVRDRFQTTSTPSVARSFYVQGVQTLTPRIFTVGRFARVSAPVSIVDHDKRSSRSSLDLSAGYRLTPEWTLKGGYEASRRFSTNDWEHAATVSVVWAKRWF